MDDGPWVSLILHFLFLFLLVLSDYALVSFVYSDIFVVVVVVVVNSDITPLTSPRSTSARFRKLEP
jgi:hypothetical protein